MLAALNLRGCAIEMLPDIRAGYEVRVMSIIGESAIERHGTLFRTAAVSQERQQRADPGVVGLDADEPVLSA